MIFAARLLGMTLERSKEVCQKRIRTVRRGERASGDGRDSREIATPAIVLCILSGCAGGSRSLARVGIVLPRPHSHAPTWRVAVSALPITRNFEAAVIALRCPHRHCAHRFMHTGEGYRTAGLLTCPECGGETPVDLDLLKKLHEKQVKMLRQARNRMRTLGI